MESWPRPSLPALPGSGGQVRVHDTASQGPVVVGSEGRATVYACGITPYDATHLGHAATYLAYDLLQRALLDAGLGVDYVQNITDVDEPLLERAARDGVDWRELAEQQVQLYRDDMTALRVLPPRAYVGAVESIPRVVTLVEDLLAKGAAYYVDDDVYFSVDSVEAFGSVGHLDQAEMLRLAAERGGDPERPGKKDPLDPVLWWAEKPGEPAWDSSLGRGRPGWHIECAAIAITELGPTIDVQGGGSDLVFPHHELGSAEAIAATGQAPFARAFVHTGMVALDGEKMSKSRGNLVFVSRLRADGADPAAIRLALLAHHYRSDWEWTPDQLDQAAARLRLWTQAVAAGAGAPVQPVLREVRAALSDDLNAPAALRAVDSWARSTIDGDRSDDAAGFRVRSLCDALLGVLLP